MRAALPANLRKLVDDAGGRDDVCDDLGINRRLMDRYLSGSAIPSVARLTELSNYFGIPVNALTECLSDAETSIELEKAQAFKTVYQTCRTRFNEVVDARPRERFAPDGFYLKYNYYLSNRDTAQRLILVSPAWFEFQDGMLIYRRNHIPPKCRKTGDIHRRYFGHGYRSRDEVFVEFADSQDGCCFAYYILTYPDFPPRDLCGVQLATAPTAILEPVATRVYFFYQGKNPDRREMYRKMSFLDEATATESERKIVDWLSRPVEDDNYVMRANP